MTSAEKPRHLAREPKFGFALLLFCLIASLMVPAFFENPIMGGTVLRGMLALILLASLYLLAYQLLELLIGIVLVIPILMANWWSGLLPLHWSVYAGSAFCIVFLFYISIFIFRFIFETEQITLNMIFAGICLYLYIGLIWTFIYLVTEVSRPGSFSFATELPADPEGLVDSLRSNFSYFSYVTLTALGYGDVTPLTRFARSWAILEALTGQFYLAVVVARLIGLFVVYRRNNLSR
jgi:ion channel